MKGVCFQGIEQVACLDTPDPQIETPADAIVAVELAGLCGSDLHPYFGRERGLDLGTVMGHEFVGTVVEVGANVRTLTVGDRVFSPFSTNCGRCFYCGVGLTSRCVENQLFGWRSGGRGLHGAQSQFVRVPLAQSTLAKITPGITSTAALLLGDNFGTGWFCAEMAGVGPDGVYAVVGCGTVGLLAILAARQLGASKFVAIDLVPERRAQAESLGAIAVASGEAAMKVLNELTEGRGADAVLELVGLPAAQRMAFELLRPGGTLAVVGCHCEPKFAFSPVEAYDKNITYKTGRCPARWYMDRLSALVAAGNIELDRFITHEFELADCRRAYEVFSKRLDGCQKAVFRIR